MLEPRRWTIRGGEWVSWYGFVPPSIYPLLDSKESVEVIEAAPVDARIAELEAELDRLRRIEKAARGALSVSRSVLDHSVREMP